MTKQEENFKILQDLGILVPYDEGLTLFCCIARESDEKEWKVDPYFENYKNNDEQPVLYASTFKVATNNLCSRALQSENMSGSYYKPETYKILPYQNGKYFLNIDFDFNKLNEHDKKIVLETLNIILQADSIEASKLSKPSFFDKEDFHYVYNEMSSLQNWDDSSLIKYEMIEKYCSKTRCSRKLANQIAGIINSIKSLKNNFVETLNCCLSDVFSLNNAPLDKEYLLSWARKNNIVGCIKNIYSDKVGVSQAAYFIFDKTVVGTEKQIWKREAIKNREREFANIIEDFTENESLKNVLSNSTPQEIVDYCMNLPLCYKGKTYKDIFNLSANVVPENFTVAEHTETVLRVFEDSFKDRFPEELLPFIKLIIVCHDIGKGFTQYFKDPNQKQYNQQTAKDFLSQNDVDKKIQELILFIIGDSQQFTSEYIVRRNQSAKNNLDRACKELLQGLGMDYSRDVVFALSNICLALQSCDGGAYTIYAFTSDRQNLPGAQYKNCNEEFSQAYMHSLTGEILPKMMYYDEENQ